MGECFISTVKAFGFTGDESKVVDTGLEDGHIRTGMLAVLFNIIPGLVVESIGDG